LDIHRTKGRKEGRKGKRKGKETKKERKKDKEKGKDLQFNFNSRSMQVQSDHGTFQNLSFLGLLPLFSHFFDNHSFLPFFFFSPPFFALNHDSA